MQKKAPPDRSGDRGGGRAREARAVSGVPPATSPTTTQRPKRRGGRALFAPAALVTLLAGGGADLPAAPEREVAGEETDERLLAGMSELDRVGLIAGGAVSPSPRVRLAIARALRHAPPTCGSLSAIEHLAADPTPEVRAAIAEAAWLRRPEAPARLDQVLYRLAEDEEPFVRAVARLALGDAR